MRAPSQSNRSCDLLVIGSGAAGGGAAEVAHAAGFGANRKRVEEFLT